MKEKCGNFEYGELLNALESARTHLAVAIAAEAKSTPIQRWQYYLDTSYRLCCFVRQLRKSESALCLQYRILIRALDSLRGLPIHGDALQLCKILRGLVEEIGETGFGRS